MVFLARHVSDRRVHLIREMHPISCMAVVACMTIDRQAGGAFNDSSLVLGYLPGTWKII